MGNNIGKQGSAEQEAGTASSAVGGAVSQSARSAAASDATPSNNDSAGLSKNAQKRQAREQRWQEKKRARKSELKKLRAQKTIEKRKDREQYLKTLPAAQRQQILKSRTETLRTLRVDERARKEGLRQALTTGTQYNVCIDLGWNSQMREKELKSVCRQLMYSYNALKKCVMEGHRPVSLTICGVDESVRPMMNTTANGWELWPILVTDASLTAMHDTSKIVYLTHDAEEVLHTLSPDDVYVIGGIVDRNRLKGATWEKARQLGTRAARLNLDTKVSIEHGTRVLTVNHCVEILLHVANGMSWGDAYMKVLPERKGLTTTVPSHSASKRQTSSHGNADSPSGNTLAQQEVSVGSGNEALMDIDAIEPGTCANSQAEAK